MSKWKCEICGMEFENFHAQGFDHTIYCPLCYFKELYRQTELERERLNNIIDKAKKETTKQLKGAITQEFTDLEKILNILELKGGDKE